MGPAGTPSGVVGPTAGTAVRWEPPSRSAVVVSFCAVLVMALSLGPSFAHLLEAPPRLTVWPPELWREATVSVVAPANAVLAQWEPGPIPADFADVRDRWEAGHIAISAVEAAGLCCALAGGLVLGRCPDRRSR